MAEHPVLFRMTDQLRKAESLSPSFTTPLGRLDLRLMAGDESLLPTSTFAADDRSVVVWSSPVRFELLLTRPQVSLPPGMEVSGTLAAVWRAGPVEDLRPLVVECVWADGATWSDVGPESGENLDAQSWTDGQTKVTVGLPDFGDATTYRRDGFAVAVGADNGRQGHFVCAWGPDVWNDVSTWFAVDCAPSALLPPGD